MDPTVVETELKTSPTKQKEQIVDELKRKSKKEDVSVTNGKSEEPDIKKSRTTDADEVCVAKEPDQSGDKEAPEGQKNGNEAKNGADKDSEVKNGDDVADADDDGNCTNEKEGTKAIEISKLPAEEKVSDAASEPSAPDSESHDDTQE